MTEVEKNGSEINYLHHLDIDYDIDKLRNEIDNIQFKDEYTIPLKTGTTIWCIPEWQLGLFNEELNHLARFDEEKFSETAKIKYWILHIMKDTPSFQFVFTLCHNHKAGYRLAPHTDDMIAASILILLSEDNGPVSFHEYGDVYYESALLNVGALHSVNKYPKDRLFVKFNLCYVSYEEAVLAFQNYYNKLP